MVLERPKVAQQSAGYVCPAVFSRPAVEDMRGIPWYMTMEEVHAELDQAEKEFEAGLGIPHENFLEEIKKW
jgi:hypothetical protein